MVILRIKLNPRRHLRDIHSCMQLVLFRTTLFAIKKKIVQRYFYFTLYGRSSQGLNIKQYIRNVKYIFTYVFVKMLHVSIDAFKFVWLLL